MTLFAVQKSRRISALPNVNLTTPSRKIVFLIYCLELSKSCFTCQISHTKWNYLFFIGTLIWSSNCTFKKNSYTIWWLASRRFILKNIPSSSQTLFCARFLECFPLPPRLISHTHIITMTSYWARWRLTSQPHYCLLKRKFSRRQKNASNLRVTVLCAGNSPVTGEFPAQMASNAEKISIWWRHHVYTKRNLNQITFGLFPSPSSPS